MAPTDKPFVCSCQEELRNRDDVDRHDKKWFELGHTKRCQFTDCDKVSPQTYNAKRHWKTHLPAELGRHFCKKCSTSYAKKHDLKKHEAADTCRYNRQKCQTKSEHSPGVSILPNLMQNDSSIASANVSEPEPAQSKDLSKDISLPPVSAQMISSTEPSYPTQDHLGRFPFLDDRVGAWSHLTAIPPPQLAPGEFELRDPDPSINSGNLAFVPWQMASSNFPTDFHTTPNFGFFDISLDISEASAPIVGAPKSWSTSQPVRWEEELTVESDCASQSSRQFLENLAGFIPRVPRLPRLQSLPPQLSQRPHLSQRARLAAEVEMMVSKIKGLCRGDKSTIKSASTTKKEAKVAYFSLPFRLRRSATPSTRQSVAEWIMSLPS
jgi:hypothetical protein